MKFSTPGVICGLLVAIAITWKLGGTSGAGVLTGALAGASIALFAALWQRHALRFHPERVMRSMVEGFLFKFAVLLMGALAFRYIDSLALRVDYRTFILSYALAALVIMTLGLIDLSAVVRQNRRKLEESEAL